MAFSAAGHDANSRGTPTDAPAGLENLPELPGLFVGRAGDMERLEVALAGGGDAVVQAVHGLGPAAIDTGLASLAGRLQPGLGELLPIPALRDRALGWLASHDRWLIVLDNVTDPAHVKALLAQAPAGKFVITSRRATGWHGLATPVHLDVLTPGQAGQWLAAIITHGRSPPRAASTARTRCALSWGTCRWPSSRPARTSPRPAHPA